MCKPRKALHIHLVFPAEVSANGNRGRKYRECIQHCPHPDDSPGRQQKTPVHSERLCKLIYVITACDRLTHAPENTKTSYNRLMSVLHNPYNINILQLFISWGFLFLWIHRKYKGIRNPHTHLFDTAGILLHSDLFHRALKAKEWLDVEAGGLLKTRPVLIFRVNLYQHTQTCILLLYIVLYTHAETRWPGYYGNHTPSFTRWWWRTESNFHTVHCEWECVCQSVHVKLASTLHTHTRTHMFVVGRFWEAMLKRTESLF